jgi:type 1 glutamine amidotransferase
MFKQLSLLALLAGFLAASAPPAPAADTKADRKIGVVIIDGQNNHNWRATTPWMKKVLEDSGRFTVSVATFPKTGTTEPAGPGAVAFPPKLEDFDVVLTNYNGAPWPAEFQKSLDETLKTGKIGLTIVHAANNSFAGWPEYNRMIGLGWRGNNFGDRLIVDDSGKEVRVPKGTGPGAGHGPQHAFQIIIRDSDHPITKGMPPQWMHAQDELYQGLRGPIENVHLLATAYADKAKKGSGDHEPMILTIAYGKGRVFHTPMGHDLPAMRCVGFISTLQRGTEWAATGKVTIPIPASFPTADKTSTVPAK